MNPEDQFHTGIVVDDPTAVMTTLTDLFGYQWGERIGGPITVVTESGETIEVELSAWYSTSAPRLEIVQSIPHTIWSPTPQSAIHHIGYWVDDIETEAAALEDQGYIAEATGTRPDGKTYWTYHNHPSGARVELVSRAMQPTMEQYFATGKVPS